MIRAQSSEFICQREAGEKAQWREALAAKAEPPELNQDPHGGREEPTPTSGPLTSTCTCMHTQRGRGYINVTKIISF